MTEGPMEKKFNSLNEISHIVNVLSYILFSISKYYNSYTLLYISLLFFTIGLIYGIVSIYILDGIRKENSIFFWRKLLNVSFRIIVPLFFLYYSISIICGVYKI
jgi:hypothetical protein